MEAKAAFESEKIFTTRSLVKIVLAWREATVRNRPLLEKVIGALRGRLGRNL